MQTIELDCAPGNTRPGDLIAGVIASTGLPERDPVSKLFGCWMWNYEDIDPALWLAAKPIIRARIESLYHTGTIRYGSW